MASQYGFSRQVAAELPQRVLVFLRAVAFSREIQEALKKYGFTDSEHQFAWAQIHILTGYHAKFSAAPSKAAEAVLQLSGADADLFRRGDAVLRRFHPKQAAFVFEGLEPASGIESVATIEKFLVRLDALEGAPEREGTREADAAALASLAARGIDSAERQRLWTLVKQAQTMDGPVQSTATEEQISAAFAALHAWYQDWSDTARAVIERRDQLIRLGVAKRKKARQSARADGEPVDTAPAEVVPPPPVITAPQAPAATSPASPPVVVPEGPSDGMPNGSSSGSAPVVSVPAGPVMSNGAADGTPMVPSS
jgi:hypothetical protein